MSQGIYHNSSLSELSFLVTGGAGFIGSNIVEYLLRNGAGKVRVLDNFATGKRENIEEFLSHPSFEFLEGDIRNLDDCRKAVDDIMFVSHHAALGSVPRTIKDPISATEVNINGTLNMLVAARDEKVRRFVYAASSSTYGDSESLPKVEDVIGKPLSPYAITKYVNELYADVFFKTYGFDSVGMRYFNVFGRRQDPNGAYAAVIPKFVMQFMKYESPVINGDGTNSRDFTYIDNVIQMNMLTMLTDGASALNTVYNTAYGERTTLKELVTCIKSILSEYDSKISEVPIIYGPNRLGDIPHSHASIEKAKIKLGYNPEYSLKQGLNEAIKWYWDNL